MITTVLFVSLIVFLVLNVPVGIAIGLSCWTSILLNSRLSDSFIVQQLISGSDSAKDVELMNALSKDGKYTITDAMKSDTEDAPDYWRSGYP